MTRLVSDRPRSWSWSHTFGLASNTVVPDKTLCDMIMVKCNKHLYFFRANSAETVPDVTGHHITLHFLTFSAQSYFLITKMRVATNEFFCYVFLLLFN